MNSERGYATVKVERPHRIDSTGPSAPPRSSCTKDTSADRKDSSSDRFHPPYHERENHRDKYSSSSRIPKGRNDDDWKCWEVRGSRGRIFADFKSRRGNLVAHVEEATCGTHSRFQYCKRCETRRGGSKPNNNADGHYSRRGERDPRSAHYDDVNNFQDRNGRGRPSRGGRDRSHDRDNDERNDYYGNAGGGRRDSRAQDRKRRYSHDEHDRSVKSKNNREPPRRQKKMWPPHFESSGASYVFDARSGLFYDATSNFFYDPKLKLYYGNEKQKYYEYCGESGARPPFREVDNQKQDSSATKNAVGGEDGANAGDKVILSGQDLIVQALQGGAANHSNMKKDEKKKIAICLKTKTSSGKNNAKSTVNKDKTNVAITLPPSSQTEKKHNEDIEKWAKRGKEAQDFSNTTKVNDRAGEDIIIPADTCKKVSTEVKTTTSGKPICLLCRRKFADIKKLRQHEKLSALHKENLLKQKKKTEQSDETTNKANTSDNTFTEYRDRAKERRSMYGTETSSLATSPTILNLESGPSLTNARVVTDVDTVTPSQSLGESNIGNQLLQKLGWTKGSSLGRNSVINGGTEQVGPADKRSASQETTSSTAADNLKKDWERIESLSGAAGGGGYRSASGKGGYNDRTYV